MDQRAQYLIQVFEKIGSPLMTAVLEAAHSNPEQKDLGHDAQKVAELLGKSIQTSIELSQIIDISKLQEDGDSMRVALTGVSSPIIGALYKRSGKTPDDAALKKVMTAMESVLSFSENFTADEAHVERLKNLEAQGQTSDQYQIYVQYIHAFIPVLNALSAFTFGQNEQKLVMEVSSRLSVKASAIRKVLFPGLPSDFEKQVDLAILKALAEIYSACHMLETQRVGQLSDEQRAAEGPMSLAPIWKLFDERVALLETLAGNILPESAQNASGTQAGAPAPPPVAVETAPVAPPATTPATPPAAPSAPPAAPPPATPPTEAVQTPPPAAPPPVQETPTPPQQAQQGGFNPMTNFSKKPADPVQEQAAVPPTAPVTQPPPVTPPAQAETPPPTAPAQQAEAPPAAPPPASPPPAAPEQPSEAKEESQKSSGNPMAFFKPGAQDDED